MERLLSQLWLRIMIIFVMNNQKKLSIVSFLLQTTNKRDKIRSAYIPVVEKGKRWVEAFPHDANPDVHMVVCETSSKNHNFTYFQKVAQF